MRSRSILKTFIQIASFSGFFMTLTACVTEDAPHLSDSAKLSPYEIAASLGSGATLLDSESLEGVWVSITESNESYSWESGAEYEIETGSYRHQELYAIKSNEDSASIQISRCSSAPDASTRPVFQYELSEDRGNFLIEKGGMIKGLEFSTVAIIESNNKITLSHYSTYYSENYSESYIQELGTHSTTMVKISDYFNPDIGYIEVNGKQSEVNCFHYTEGVIETEINDASGARSGTRSIEQYQFQSQYGQTTLSRARAPSNITFDNGDFYVVSDWPELFSISRDSSEYISELTINIRSLEFYGDFSATLKTEYDTFNTESSVSFLVMLKPNGINAR